MALAPPALELELELELELVREPERLALARVLRELAPLGPELQGPQLREPGRRFRGWLQASGVRNRRKGLPR